MGPIEASSRSFTNISLGLPPVIGIELEQSLYDIIKPLDIAYDVAFWKRQMLVSTYKGTKTALNSSMVPNEWDPERWVQLSDIDGYLLMDPTQEILKGPSQGKAAGINNWVTQEVKGTGNDEGIRLLTEYMSHLEDTMGKISGVRGAREGEISERSAVRNNQFEISQFTKITEHWFIVEQEFKRIAMQKYLEVCKLAYKKNPMKGTYVLGHLGQAFLQYYDEFAETEYDLYFSNGREDTELFNKLQQSIDQAIAQGKGALHDLVTISSSNSVQKITRDLKKSAEEVFKQQQQIEQQRAEAMREQQMAQAMENEAQREHEKELKILDIEAKEYTADRSLEGTIITAQSRIKAPEPEKDDRDPLDLEKLILDKQKADEVKRHNRELESIAREKNKISRIQRKTPLKK
jgi:hypothetical protein